MIRNLRIRYKWIFLMAGIAVVLAAGVSVHSSTGLTSASGPITGYQGLANPAAVYCIDMGYEYRVINTPEGQQGICRFPNGEACDDWAFLTGTCGAQYSYCAQQGYGIQTLTDGQNPFSPEYAVCVSERGQLVGSVTTLTRLSEKASGCYPGPCPETEFEPIPSPETSGEPAMGELPAVQLPAEFNWTTYQGQDWMSEVKNQGGCGSCWAFAAAGAAEAAHNIRSGNPNLDVDLSEQHLVSECFSAGSCSGGPPGLALEYIRDHGIPDEECMPYLGENSVCSMCPDGSNRLVTIDSTGSLALDRQVLQENLVTAGPIVVGIGMYGDFDAEGIYRCAPDRHPNHAVVITGYNDAGNYWIAKNSWGIGWNGDGYFKVGYGECFVDSSDAFYARADQHTSTTVAPTDDAQVSSLHPASNFGASSFLGLLCTPTEDIDSYLKFTLSGLSGRVELAALRLYVYDGSDSGGAIYRAGNAYKGTLVPWAEAGINWNNAPFWDSTPLSTRGAVAGGTWVEYPVTAAITGNGTYSFGLTSLSSDSLYAFSKEGIALTRPQLFILVSGPIIHPPILVDPEDNTVFTDPAAVTFTWQSPQAPGQTGYNFRISQSADPFLRGIVNTWLDPTTTSYTYTFPRDGQFYWHMQTTTAEKNSTWTTRHLTIDTGPPWSAVQYLPMALGATTFTVSWDGFDAGSGIAYYDVQYQDNHGAWQNWQMGTTETAALFTGVVGHTYGFRCRAQDRLGNLEEWPTSPDTETTIVKPVPNDDFDNAFIIDHLPYSKTQDTTGALPALDDPYPDCGPDDLTTSVWYRYTATDDTVVRFETTGSNYPTVLVVYTGTRGALTEMGCSECREVPFQTVIDLPVTAGTTYHIVVSGWYWDYGTLVFSARDLLSDLVITTLSPTDDTYVKSEYPNSNYNGQDYLRVRKTLSYDNDAYLKFDLSDLAGTVQRATLRLYAYDGSDDGGSVYAVANTYRGSGIPWTETGLTWNNAPLFGGTPIASTGAVTDGAWVEFDVTAAVTGPGIYSFAVSNESYRSIFFYAKEAGSYLPELVVETHVVPPSFGPTDDTYVKSEYPKSNYGGQDYLRVRRTRSYDNNAYLKFDLNSLSGTVQRATLRLYAYDGSDDGGAVYTVTNTYRDSSIPWTEAGLTWNNAPPILGAPLDSVGKVTDDTWVEFDVTAAVTGPGIYSFAISNESYRSIFFYAKEAGQYPPELVIDIGENSFEETHPAWTWQGGWLPYSQSGASGGMVFSYAAIPPAPIDTYAEFSFTAAGFNLYYHKSPAGGIANLFIDDMDTPYAQIEMYADHDQWLQEAMLHVEGLDPAVPHTLRIVPTGDKNLLSTGYVISIDRLDLLDVAP